MNQNPDNLYEGMYVIKASLSDEARQRVLEKIQNSITQKGGEFLKMLELGRRRLAYEIDNHREGYYFVLYFKAPPQAISELWVEYHLNEDLLRFLTLRTNKVMQKLEFKELAEQH